jgi:hypothetical protein
MYDNSTLGLNFSLDRTLIRAIASISGQPPAPGRLSTALVPLSL